MSQNNSKRYPYKRKKQNFPWRSVLAVAGGVLLLGLAFFTLRGGSGPKADIEVTSAPSLKVDKEKVDLGDMKFNQVAEVSFRLTNVGDQTLRFSKDPYMEVVEGC